MPLWVQGLGVFAVAFCVDVAFTFYVRRTAEGKAGQAAAWSGMIAAMNALNVVAYVQDFRLVVPVILGYIAGTYVAVRYDKKA